MGAVGENGLTLSTHFQAGGDCPGPEKRTWGSGGNRSGGLALALLNAAALHRERDCPAVTRRLPQRGLCRSLWRSPELCRRSGPGARPPLTNPAGLSGPQHRQLWGRGRARGELQPVPPLRGGRMETGAFVALLWDGPSLVTVFPGDGTGPSHNKQPHAGS